MSSLWGRFKTKDGPTPSAKEAPVKKDPNTPQPTPLELMLADAGPIRNDGSDKFFGIENFGSTCYCNSIIQCLYYSVPFREQVINFPARTPIEALKETEPSALPQLHTDPATTTQNGLLLPTKAKGVPPSTTVTSPARKPVTPNNGTPTPGTKPEDNKDSPEYRKKLILAAGPIINMDYENSQSYGMTESLFASLKDIFEAIIAHKSRMGVVSPHKFLEILRNENEMFRTAMHQDAHEFLNLLLNEVVDDVEKFSRKAIAAPQEPEESALELSSALTSSVSAGMYRDIATNASASNTKWVHELFEGTLTSETRCLTCENTSQRDEAFLDLSVDLEQHSSVTSCLRKFSEEEMLCERNKFHCDRCGGLQEAEKRMKIKRLPRILALHLKRFKYTEDLQRLQKLFHRVVYPYYLRLFNTTDDAEDPDRLYELYAVVVHIGGGPYHGHYVSVIKTQDRGWLLFDDELVEPVDKSYVRNFFGGENVLACAYVLFYQETTVEAMQKEQEAEGLAAAQKAAEREKEAVNSGKVNGATANGYHHVPVPTTPTDETEPHFISLDRVASAPMSPQSPSAAQDEPEHTLTSPLESTVPTLSSTPKNRKADAAAKKEKKAVEKAAEKERKAQEKAQEKERKAQEKEREKEMYEKQRSVMDRRREALKKQDEELQAAIEASKASAAEEARRTGTTNTESSIANTATTTTTTTSTEATEASSEFEALSQSPRARIRNEENLKEKGLMGHGLSRFRNSSMSLRNKPKWLGNKDKGEHDTSLEPGKDDKKDGKNRFSLGKKKSGFFT
ncbi:cysteine proteinase [Pseudovirgaria hyperparasitica]|uniref:Ubiquitin carboxyl-terminal hydrolase n=1 Tax=Pseudovirgaria hyperparasitica TaxID=470096 RepID=A0A6A6W399_9PEZI|nr:cysteine proteinase [Pseudovirgaria hyperparasitica]KAF2756609.1 cysteine proteinase [Pseudovirgaria hyperparasitica]